MLRNALSVGELTTTESRLKEPLDHWQKVGHQLNSKHHFSGIAIRGSYQNRKADKEVEVDCKEVCVSLKMVTWRHIHLLYYKRKGLENKKKGRI